MDNSTPGHNELLMRYLDNQVTKEERNELERKAQSDPALREELDGLMLAREAVRQHGIRQEVGRIHSEMVKERKTPVHEMQPRRRNFRYAMSIAATIILALGLYFTYNFFSLSADRMYSSSYQPYELSTLRGESASDEMIRLYRSGNYKGVIDIYTGKDSSVTAAFLAAMSHLRRDEISEAIPLLERSSKVSAGNPFVPEAEYYLALAYIKNRDFDLALPLLEKIHGEPSHLYNERVDRKMIRKTKWLKWR